VAGGARAGGAWVGDDQGGGGGASMKVEFGAKEVARLE
jgi:hypothetical protein